MIETWREIPGYFGLFKVSNKGRIKKMSYWGPVKGGNYYRLHKDRILKPTQNHKGYLALRLYAGPENFKPYTVHKLVMMCFGGNRPSGLDQINHKNGIKTDNRIENLEWSNNSHNIKHAYKNGLFKPKLPSGVNSPHAKLLLHKEYGIYLNINEASKMEGVRRNGFFKNIHNYKNYLVV